MLIAAVHECFMLYTTPHFNDEMRQASHAINYLKGEGFTQRVVFRNNLEDLSVHTNVPHYQAPLGYPYLVSFPLRFLNIIWAPFVLECFFIVEVRLWVIYL